MREYSTTPVQDNLSHASTTPRARRALSWCLAHTWTRNANFSSAAHSKRRMRMEGQLARGFLKRAALVEGLRKRARHSARRDELHRAAELLDATTPASLGVEAVAHPARGGGKRALPYYIPDVALPAVAAFLGLLRWAHRLLDEHARGAWIARMRRVAVMLGAIVRDSTAYGSATPYPSTGEKAPQEPSLSGTSEPAHRAWRLEKWAWPDAVGGGELA